MSGYEVVISGIMYVTAENEKQAIEKASADFPKVHDCETYKQ